jgi:hypothetical protein
MSHRDTRYVVHIDILGMSALVEKDPELAWQALSALVHARDHVGAYEVSFLDTAERTKVGERVHCVTFSDTIVLFTKSDELIDLRTVIVVASEIFNKALSTCIPVRVGIAHGTFFFNLADSMYAGPALIEAYRIGEEAQWLGLTVSETVYLRATQAQMHSGNHPVVIATAVPTDSGLKDGFAVNWPVIVPRHDGVSPPFTVQQFYSAFEAYFGPFSSLPPRVRTKYENTVSFYNTNAA